MHEDGTYTTTFHGGLEHPAAQDRQVGSRISWLMYVSGRLECKLALLAEGVLLREQHTTFTCVRVCTHAHHIVTWCVDAA